VKKEWPPFAVPPMHAAAIKVAWPQEVKKAENAR